MKKAEYNHMAKQKITGLVVAVVILLAACAFLAPRLPSSPMLRDSFWAHKIDPGKQYDIVLVGDSRVYRGLDPEVIESRLNGSLSCFNYGFSSAGLDSFLLNHAAALLNPGGVMVIGLSANSFTEESARNEHLHSLLKWNNKDVWIRKHLYPMLSIFDAYRISDFANMVKKEGYYEDYHLKYGFAASYKVPLDSSSALSAYKRQFSATQYSPVVEKNFLVAVLDLQMRGIKVAAFRMPTSAGMCDLENQWLAGRLDKLEKKLRAMGVIILDPGPGSYRSYDGSHLEKESAERLSWYILR